MIHFLVLFVNHQKEVKQFFIDLISNNPKSYFKKLKAILIALESIGYYIFCFF